MSVLGMAELQSATFYFAQLAVKTHKWCRPVRQPGRWNGFGTDGTWLASLKPLMFNRFRPRRRKPRDRKNTFGWEAHMKKHILLLAAAGVAIAMASSAIGADKIKIGFLPGVVDPFYQVMQLGVEKAAKDFGVEVVTQVPQSWGVEQETPLLNAMIARGDLNYIITAPVDKDQMVAPLQAALDAGIKVITVDTFLGDGDYANGAVKFPISYIGSDNEMGDRIAADGLAKANGEKGTVYIHSPT